MVAHTADGNCETSEFTAEDHNSLHAAVQETDDIAYSTSHQLTLRAKHQGVVPVLRAGAAGPLPLTPPPKTQWHQVQAVVRR